MKFNKLFLFAATLFAAVALHAQTPTYAPQTLASCTLAASTATNLNVVIDCRKQASVTVQIAQTASASSTAATTLVYARSVDGSKFETSLSTAAFAQTGTTEMVGITNLPTLGCGFIKILYATNAHASANLTALSLKYGVKISAP